MNSVTRLGLLIVIAIIQLLAPAVAAPPDQPITVEPKVFTGPLEPRAQKAPEQLRGDANHALGNRLIRLESLSAKSAKAMIAQDPVGPTKIGFGRDVPSLKAQQDTTTQLDWKPTTGGMIGSLAINSNGAAALRVGIRIQSIPDSAEVRFFSDNATEVQLVSGKTIMDLIKQNLSAGDPEESARVYWSPAIQGEIAGVEVFIPDGVNTDEVQISIPQVSHLTVSPQSGGLNQQLGNPGDSAACELDAMCYPDWQTTGNSVARIIRTIGGSTGYCTGTLLNDKNGSLIPYFLTADHCISDQTTANSLQAYWFYHSTACNSRQLFSGFQVTGSGATLLNNSSRTSDFSFLRLNSQPPNGASFSGWSANASEIGQITTGLHNPMGDMQKLSSGSVNGFAACVLAADGGLNCSRSNDGSFLEIGFSKGITEGGSSGSGLFSDSGKYLVGQLSGGGNSCTNLTAPSYYGRFDKTYPSVSRWLSPGDYSIDVYPVKYDFGSVPTGSINKKDFIVTNNGKYSVSFKEGWPSARGDGFYISSKTCFGILQKNQKCNIEVSFQPPTSGPYSNSLEIRLNELSVIKGADYLGSAIGLPIKYAVNINKTGSGVIGIGDSVSCGQNCMGEFSASSIVILRSSEAPGYRFSGFSGDCPGPDTSICTLRMTSPKNVTATFKPYLKFNAQTGGSITTIPAGQSCGSGCLMFDEGTSVTVSAKPDAGYTFSGWSGDCSGQGQCTLNLSNIPSARSVVASFALPSLLVSNPGDGSITSSPAGINCGSTCSASFASGTSVTLTATPNSGYTFTGWAGACSGTGACVVTMNSNQSVSASFSKAAPDTYLLSVPNPANGTITSSPSGINCGSTCSASFNSGTSVILTATPNTGYKFTGWTGACTGTGACTVTMSTAQIVTANFSSVAPSTFLLSISNPGNGTITSSPSGINCGGTCNAPFNSGTSVTLTATPNAGYSFTGWTGACNGTGACVVTMNSIQSVAAIYTALPILSVYTGGNGTVTSSPSGINCGSKCGSWFNSGTSVTLTASPNSGFTFTGWYGACSGRGACILTMNSDQSVTASFSSAAPSTYTLDLFNSGNGSVTSSPSGINCGSTCSASFNSGTTVTMTATPNSGYTFTGWSGACSGVGACILTIDSYKSVSATFSQSLSSNYQLSVVNSGNGNVTSSPSGISCGFLCNYAFSSGATVTLTAAPNAGYTFTGWSGACSGIGACTVTMSSNQSVSASFTQTPTALNTIKINITGDGSVNNITGIGFGGGPTAPRCTYLGGVTTGICSFDYPTGTVVTLNSWLENGYLFTGWSGACSGMNSCMVTMDSNKTVTASFSPMVSPKYTLTLISSGLGSVTSSPAGINCGGICSASFNSGSSITLTATPNSGYTFSGWSGACSGTGNCVVTMNATQDVFITASFSMIPEVLNITKIGNGTITSTPAGINCGPTCSFAFPQGAVVSLTAVPDNGYIFSGWSGACTGSGNCSVTMASNQNVTATFTAIPLLSVTKVGNGTITSTPSGINCGPTCSFAYSQGSSVSLTAAPDSGYTFSGWSGACTGSAACNVTMSAAQTVAATFTALPNVFSKITVTRPTLGVIASDAAKINCGIKAVACSNSLQQGTVITLTAAPKAGYYTKGWSGCTSSTGDSCVLTIGGAPMGVSATFAPTPKFNLRVTKNKLGTVTSDPAGINCKANVTSCSSKIFSGTKVTLTATPSAGRTFVGWTGACSGKDVCSLTMDGAKGVSATFQ